MYKKVLLPGLHAPRGHLRGLGVEGLPSQTEVLLAPRYDKKAFYETTA